ncbi:TonB-dependent receptor [Sphingomicrobium sediminis]|uniref:TonB-dependent receptor n=1 Tax=Sphingomicrobium sediminis TaxID=2950949 RepID=A0A9X2J3T2_9SPHN|nr:TonB-dependent receptor [Sphingomicrobium sediminis]MCM8557651.1 TonB-dependent receptor [Sphingomicrobium sediminis]
MRRTTSLLSYSALALAMAATANPALAQSTDEEADVTTPQEVAEPEEGIGVIVITAQRYEQNLQDVPISVATVDADVLNAVSTGGADIRGLAGRVPSLNIESSFGRTFPRFYIRGLGNTDFDLNASQPVSLVYDDVVLENPILKGFPVFDMERVEVLRGPQGTLFGRNTPAGIVKFDSRRPDSNENYFRGSYGTYDTINIESGMGGELSDEWSIRASVLYQHRADWIDNIDTPEIGDLEGYDDFAARLQLQYEPTDFATFRLTGQIRDMEGSARIFRANALVPEDNDLQGVIIGDEFKRDQVRADGINFQRLETKNVALTADFDIGADATLTSVTSYWGGSLESRGDIDGGFGNQFGPEQGPGFIPFSAQSRDDIPSLSQITQEVRIASNPATGFGYQAGAFFFWEDLEISSEDYGTPTDLAPAAIANQEQFSEGLGVFGTLRYAFDNGVTLQGGLRYNRDRRDFRAARPLDTRPGFLGFGGPVDPIETTVEDEVVTWDVAATYEVNDNVNIYARAAKGYRAPSIQGRLLFGRDLSVADSETTMSYEAGVKTEFNRALRFNLTGYFFETEDLQLTAVGGENNFTRLLNAAEVDGYGLEAELVAAPLPGLLLTAGASYNSTETQDPGAFVAGCASGCTVLDPERGGAPGIFSIDGNPLPQAPDWTINWTAGYEVPVGNGDIYVFTDWYYRSEIQFFLYESVEYSDPDLLEGGLRIGYRTNTFDIAGFVRNITNDYSPVGGIDFNNLTAFVNEPRIYGVELGVNF